MNLNNRHIVIYRLRVGDISHDDTLTEEDIVDIKQTSAEYASGETIPASAIN